MTRYRDSRLSGILATFLEHELLSDLADEADVHRSTLAAIAAGKEEPTREVVDKLAVIFNDPGARPEHYTVTALDIEGWIRTPRDDDAPPPRPRGQAGGNERARRLSPERRREIARQAAGVRHHREDERQMRLGETG